MHILSRIKYLLLLFLFASTPALATLVHSHCDIKQWKQTSFSTNPAIPSLLADYATNDLGFFSFQVPLNLKPPKSLVPDCDYEISDIRAIDVTFKFENVPMMVWQSLLMQDALPGGGFGAFYVDGTATEFINDRAFFYRFAGHQGDPAGLRDLFELTMPSGSLNFQLAADANLTNFKITEARIEVRGTHYYVVSEPTSIALILVGLSMLGATATRRRRRHDSLDLVGLARIAIGPAPDACVCRGTILPDVPVVAPHGLLVLVPC